MGQQDDSSSLSETALMSGGQRTSTRVRVVVDDDGFDALSPDWMRLHEAINASAFKSFEWQRNWWRHFGGAGRGCSLHLLVVENDGVIVGIGPLMIRLEPVLGPIRLKAMQFLASGISDYEGILCEAVHSDGVATAMAHHLRNVRFDVLLLNDLRDATGVSSLLRERLAQSNWTVFQKKGDSCPHTVLGDTWEETLKGFAASHRKRLSYMQRRLEREFSVEFQRVTDPSQLNDAMLTMMSMHQRHWVGTGFAGAFHAASSQHFHLETARDFLRRGWLVLAFLRIDGKVAASLYAFKVGKSLQFYLSGRSETDEFVKYSPGIVIHLYCMQAMIREGIRDYDFLRGTESYKYMLGAKDFETWSLIAFKPGARYAEWKHNLGNRKRQLVAGMKDVRRSIRMRLAGVEKARQPESTREDG
jgi:CelD/BcsL family acetyltransferase involved in cellulose biosynthesis